MNHPSGVNAAHCVSCRAAIDAAVTFCPHCGADQRPPSRRPPTSPQPAPAAEGGRKALGGLAIGCGCVSMCMLWSFIFGLGMSSPSPRQQPGPLGLFLVFWPGFSLFIALSTLGLGVGFGLLYNRRVGLSVAGIWFALVFIFFVVGQLTMPQ